MKKHTLLIGVGQIGCETADLYAYTMRPEDGNTYVLAIDTDSRTADNISCPFISLGFEGTVCDVLDSVNPLDIKGFFPCDRDNDCIEYFETITMNSGSNQWRMKALLALYYYLSRPDCKNSFIRELAKALPENSEEPYEVDVQIVASLAGGTGSGLCIPLAYILKPIIKKLGAEKVTVSALLTLPDVCEELLTSEQRIKARANTYATVKEIDSIAQFCYGECEPFDFKIGDEKDPILGLLFDASNPEYAKVENLPFTEVCLYRRLPGTHSIQGQLACLVDALRSLCSQPRFSTDTSCIYCGISITKTVYSHKSILKYITLQYLNDTADEEWMPMFRAAKKELSNAKILTQLSGSVFESSPEDIARAVIEANKVPEDEEEALISSYDLYEEDEPTKKKKKKKKKKAKKPKKAKKSEKQKEEDQLEAARQQLLNAPPLEFQSFVDKIDALIEKKLSTPDTVKLTATFDRVRGEEAAKNSIFGRGGRKQELIDAALNAKKVLNAYFMHNHKPEDAILELQAKLTDADSDVNLIEEILIEDGKSIHPAKALYKLSRLYFELVSTIEEQRQLYHSDAKIKGTKIPDRLLLADAKIGMNTRYDTAGQKRMLNLFNGEYGHLSGSPKERKLFYFDLEAAYSRLHNLFRTPYIEAVLEEIGKVIAKTHSFLNELDKVLDDEIYDSDTALHRDTGKKGTVYHVGTSPEEKQFHYKKFKEQFNEKEKAAEIKAEYDCILGDTLVADITHVPDANIDEESCYILKDALEDTLKGISDSAYKVIEGDSYYTDRLVKDVYAAVTAQNGKNGADDRAFAVSKAFCGGLEPLIFELPDSNEAYLLNRRIKRNVWAVLPEKVARDIEADGGNAKKLVEAILYESGEYEGVAIFADYLPENELRIIRKTTGLKPDLLELYDKTSGICDYYKAYEKALFMEQEQCTALWNPHLAVGICEDNLPKDNSKKLY